MAIANFPVSNSVYCYYLWYKVGIYDILMLYYFLPLNAVSG